MLGACWCYDLASHSNIINPPGRASLLIYHEIICLATAFVWHLLYYESANMRYFHAISWASMLGGVVGAPSIERKDVGFSNVDALFRRDEPLCHVQGFTSAPTDALPYIDTWLQDNVLAGLTVSAGTCRQLWCERGAALWICNDGSSWQSINTWEVKGYLYTCMDPCHDADNAEMGQCQLFVGDWNMIIRGADHGCFLGEIPN
ncbi:hypothetical protein GGR57DRAFT_456477 [Xylariaceae sp. FL1272]|nr:hypothetical protein GGR57DRAFT_456477 [Xylariaceae sp. FL1272]